MWKDASDNVIEFGQRPKVLARSGLREWEMYAIAEQDTGVPGWDLPCNTPPPPPSRWRLERYHFCVEKMASSGTAIAWANLRALKCICSEGF